MKSMQRLFKIIFLWHDSGESKITDFNAAIEVNKKIGGLDISVDNIGRMDKI